MTKFLDLDAISSPVDFTIKFKGVEHPVKETTVEDFIETQRLIDSHPMTGTIAGELELMIKLIKRVVPTIPEEELRGLTFTQLSAIRDFVLTANGEKAETAPAGEGAEGNEPKAN